MSDLLILGGNGQVGRALAAQARRQGIAYTALGRSECDVTDPQAVTHAVASARLVVNCAGYTAVDRAEREPDRAHRVNGAGAGHVAFACAATGIPLVHLSTDYVFDGEGARPWREEDPARPVGVYGRSKLDGEVAVRSLHARHIVLRTSWVFSAHGDNFVTAIVRRARLQQRLEVVADQVGGPTAAADVAAAMLTIAAAAWSGEARWGTYHFSSGPAVSRFEFARAIVAGSECEIVPICGADHPAAARRPSYSVLDCSRIHTTFGIAQPDWRVALRHVLRECVA